MTKKKTTAEAATTESVAKEGNGAAQIAEPEKKTRTRKTTAAKTEKPAAEKKTPARRTTKKSKAVKASVSVQFAGKEYTTEDLVEIAKAVWQYDLGQEPEAFASVELYVKPEESAVYYVINNDTTGHFAI